MANTLTIDVADLRTLVSRNMSLGRRRGFLGAYPVRNPLKTGPNMEFPVGEQHQRHSGFQALTGLLTALVTLVRGAAVWKFLSGLRPLTLSVAHTDVIEHATSAINVSSSTPTSVSFCTWFQGT